MWADPAIRALLLGSLGALLAAAIVIGLYAVYG
jgi:hypothetical protein